MKRQIKLTVIGSLGLIVVALLMWARQTYVAGFAQNADADAIRFYTASGIVVFSACHVACFIAAAMRR